MKTRDDFPVEVIRISKLRAAYICSRPTCRKFTIAPSLTGEMLVQYNGKVAHIAAAAAGGPRYVVDMLEEERKSISNAIFLCSNCAELIDKNNGVDYKTETLKTWKEEHHNWVLQNLNKSEADKNMSSAISTNQSGGITASIININASSPEKVDEITKHDAQTYLRSETVLNENQMHELCSSLIENAECKINNIERLNDICEFFNKAGNSFLSPSLNSSKIKFIKKIKPLTGFISSNFDKWPYSQSTNNFNIQLKPDYLRDTQYKKMTFEERQKWDELFAQLKKLVNAVYKYYNNFRKVVKHELHI
jgi:hypothetical protein